jgi:two-component system, chemotaxis family, chemotaxis protein CheV
MNEIPGITGSILLDAGTNELEVLVFRLGTGFYGVNVAKVREVIRPQTTAKAPKQHPSVIGMFDIRGSVVPLIDLAKHIQIPPASEGEKRVIITEFNGLRTGFLVDAVEQIHRMSWQRVKPAPEVNNLTGGTFTPQQISTVTGLIELDDRLILLIDFESVADAIVMQDKLHLASVPNSRQVDRAGSKVILAEDSGFMRQVIRKIFSESGYEQLHVVSNGEEAWKALNTIGPAVRCVISDIEMPRMDGLALCRSIKGDARFKDIPVVLFSSLISADNLKKGSQVGANVQIAKPELAKMVEAVDIVLSGKLEELQSVTNEPTKQAA